MKEAEKVGVKGAGANLHQQRQGQMAGVHVKKNTVHHHHHQQQQFAQGHHHHQSIQYQAQARGHHGRRSGGKQKFQRTASTGDSPNANVYFNTSYVQALTRSQQEPRVRSSSGNDEQVNKATLFQSVNNAAQAKSRSIPCSPVGVPTTTKPTRTGSSEEFFAMAKFNESPEPSALPAPPQHWISPAAAAAAVQTSPCKVEYNRASLLTPARRHPIAGLDFTAHLKTLLRVEM